MRRKLVKDDIEIIKNAGRTTRATILSGGEKIELKWRKEEIDGKCLEALTLGEIKEQLKVEKKPGVFLVREIITVITYSPYEGGAIYQYGNTESRWAKLGDLYPTHA